MEVLFLDITMNPIIFCSMPKSCFVYNYRVLHNPKCDEIITIFIHFLWNVQLLDSTCERLNKR